MEHTHKMYLVPQHQLDALKQPYPRESVRQTAENALDKAIEEVLNTPDTDLYEKAKRYGSVLQRYLSLVKQGQREQGELTLSLAEDGSKSQPRDADEGGNASAGDSVFEEVMRHIPTKSKRNAGHIMESLKKSKNVSWTDRGELVLKGETIKGSHMYDLLKNVTSSYRVLDSDRPPGWIAFLQVLAHINVPSTSIPSKRLRQLVDMYKHAPPSDSVNAIDEYESHHSGSNKRRRRERPDLPSNTPNTHESAWLQF